jgi:Icc-related predicted phosphoesterase
MVHDICAENNIIYLENDLVEIEGLKIYGSPYTPQYGKWAFMRERGDEIARIWDKIPDGLDILITHGPPKGIMDIGRGKVSAGCYDLLKKVVEVKPTYHLFGHMHMCQGIEKHYGITFINSAMVDDDYTDVRTPTVFTI